MITVKIEPTGFTQYPYGWGIADPTLYTQKVCRVRGDIWELNEGVTIEDIENPTITVTVVEDLPETEVEEQGL